MRYFLVFLLASFIGCTIHAQIILGHQDTTPAPSTPSISKDSVRENKVATAIKKDTVVNAPRPVAAKVAHITADTSKAKGSSDGAGNTSIGLGLGLDYGGILGLNATLYPAKNLGVFAGVGYAFVSVGYNAGVKLRYVSKNPYYRVNPFVEFMYGYNAVIRVTNADDLSKVFYGTTLGFGFDNQRRDRGFSMALLIPFRSKDVSDYENMLQQKYHATITQELLPILISIGYKWYFN